MSHVFVISGCILFYIVRQPTVNKILYDYGSKHAKQQSTAVRSAIFMFIMRHRGQ